MLIEGSVTLNPRLFYIHILVTVFIVGNDAISALTTNDNYMLRIDLEDFDGNHRYALYDTFVVAGENDKYKLTVGGYSGTAGIYYKVISLYDCLKTYPYTPDNLAT